MTKFESGALKTPASLLSAHKSGNDYMCKYTVPHPSSQLRFPENSPLRRVYAWICSREKSLNKHLGRVSLEKMLDLDIDILHAEWTLSLITNKFVIVFLLKIIKKKRHVQFIWILSYALLM